MECKYRIVCRLPATEFLREKYEAELCKGSPKKCVQKRYFDRLKKS